MGKGHASWAGFIFSRRRERKRARKIAKNIAKSQGAHMLELERKLELERALAGVVDWSKDSGASHRPGKRLWPCASNMALWQCLSAFGKPGVGYQ